MNLWTIPLYLSVGLVEWGLALRRTLACARGERWLMASLVLAENLLGFFVLSAFMEQRDWLVVLSYSFGGSVGALLVGKRGIRQSS